MEKQISLVEFAAKFGTEDKCIAHLEQQRWPNGVRCLKCGEGRISRIKATRKGGKVASLYLCLDCEYQFSVTAGTVFHDSHVPLTKWFLAIRLICSAKKGISARQLARELDTRPATALYMAHRIRVAMQDDWKTMAQLTGFVEADETWIGGKDKNKHKNKRQGPRGPSGKIPVIGAIERNGRVVAKVLDRVTQDTAREFLREVVSSSISLISTDEGTHYRNVSWTHRPHFTVNHEKEQYVHGAVHTNTIEGFWSLLKRGIMGSFHNVSRRYLPLYVAEFQFRYNARKEQGAMFDMVLRTCG